MSEFKTMFRFCGVWSLLALGSLAVAVATGNWALALLAQIFLLFPYLLIGSAWIYNELTNYRKYGNDV